MTEMVQMEIGMRRKLFTMAVLLAFAGGAWADEKDAKPDTQAGPPPGKGWRKNEAPPATPAPAPKGKGKLEATPAPKGKGYAPAPAKDDGIGPQVSALARSGIHGPQLAARIHQIQATMPKKTEPGKKQAAPIPPTTPKKKKGGDD